MDQKESIMLFLGGYNAMRWYTNALVFECGSLSGAYYYNREYIV